jgi:hypothetical protein
VSSIASHAPSSRCVRSASIHVWAMRTRAWPSCTDARQLGAFEIISTCCAALSSCSERASLAMSSPDATPLSEPSPRPRAASASDTMPCAESANGACCCAAESTAAVAISRNEPCMLASPRRPSKPSCRAASRPPECAKPPVGSVASHKWRRRHTWPSATLAAPLLGAAACSCSVAACTGGRRQRAARCAPCRPPARCAASSNAGGAAIDACRRSE